MCSGPVEGGYIRIYHAEHPNPKLRLNVVVAERTCPRIDGNERTELFYRTWEGKQPRELETEAERQEFNALLYGITSRRFRVSGRDLDARIRETFGMPPIAKPTPGTVAL
jgi:hypothetical protein